MDAELEGVPVSATDNHTPMPEATDELRERLRVVLAENGVDEAPATLHSWRCEYPVSYGKCDCIAELVNDLAAVVAEARTEGAIAELEAAAQRIDHPTSYPGGLPLSISPERYASVVDAAAHFQVKPITIKRWIKSGHIEAVRIGSKLIRVDLESLVVTPVSGGVNND